MLVFCPQCRLDLDEGRFGVCRARRTGRNLYCTDCCCKRVAAGRQRKKQMKMARQLAEQLQAAVERKPNVIAPITEVAVARVRRAIKLGNETWDEIKRETRLHEDLLGDALGILMLDNEEVKCRRVNGERRYVLVNREFHSVGVAA